MDAPEAKVLSDIEEVGWHVILVPEDNQGAGFAFTIGLHHSYGHPEVMMFGLPLNVMHQVLNLVGEAAKIGRRYSAGDRVANLLEGYECTFVNVPKSAYADFLGYARWYYKGDHFPAVQCVWPDASGRFPWEVGAGWSGGNQPVLGVAS